MPNRNVAVPEHESEVIDRLVSEGRYGSSDEVILAALRLLEERESEKATRAKAFEDAIDEGEAAIERGDYLEFESVDHLSEYIHQMAERVLAERQKR